MNHNYIAAFYVFFAISTLQGMEKNERPADKKILKLSDFVNPTSQDSFPKVVRVKNKKNRGKLSELFKREECEASVEGNNTIKPTTIVPINTGGAVSYKRNKRNKPLASLHPALKELKQDIKTYAMIKESPIKLRKSAALYLLAGIEKTRKKITKKWKQQLEDQAEAINSCNQRIKQISIDFEIEAKKIRESIPEICSEKQNEFTRFHLMSIVDTLAEKTAFKERLLENWREELKKCTNPSNDEDYSLLEENTIPRVITYLDKKKARLEKELETLTESRTEDLLTTEL